jgi:hypothetical protein
MTLLIGLTTVSNVGAQDAVYIQKGQPAPYSGIIFTESAANELRSEVLEKQKLKLTNLSLQNERDMYKSVAGLKGEQIEQYRRQNDALLRLDTTNKTMNYVWFGLGILATGVAVYGARGLAK